MRANLVHAGVRGLGLLLVLVALPASELESAARRALDAYVFVAQGSGVVVDGRRGLVLSNNHVVGEADRLRLRWADGSAHWATVIGRDPFGDLSLLQLESPPAGGLPALAIADPGQLRVGMSVLAVGNPFGLGDVDDTPSLSTGILSTLRVARGGGYADCLQHDAPVNPGNSGGPLVAADGRLLGINGQIRTRTGMRANTGVGLAISCVQVARFLPLLSAAEGGYVFRSRAPEGLEIRRDGAGLVVAAVADGSSLQVGDKLISIAGVSVTSNETALAAFTAWPWDGPATTVPVVVIRAGGSAQTIAVAVPRQDLLGAPWHGLQLVDAAGTVRVRAVEANSPALRAGIAAGWVVQAVDGEPISRRIDLLRKSSDLGVGDRLRLTFRDAVGGEQQRELVLRPRPGR